MNSGCSMAIKRAGPTVAVIGIVSMLGPFAMKCSGASMCVPVWALMLRKLALQMPPRSMSIRRSMAGIGSPGQCGIPDCSGTEMSIHMSTLFTAMV